MVGDGPKAVEEGVEPGSNEGDLKEGFSFPRVEEKKNFSRKLEDIRAEGERHTFCCACAGR